MTRTITICSDASHVKFHKRYINAWATYIRSNKRSIKVGGVIKEQYSDSTWAERLGIANALFLADKTHDLGKYRLILYCDNILALKKQPIKVGEKSKYYAPQKEIHDWYDENIQKILDKAESFELRHVKAHLSKDKWDLISKRHFMNQWCDFEAKRIMRLEKARIQKEISNAKK